MATVSGLFTSPARKSGTSTPHERVTAVAGLGFEGCAHARRGMLARIVDGGEVAVGDELSLL